MAKIWLPQNVRDAFNKPKPEKAYGLDVILVKQNDIRELELKKQKPVRERRICPTCGKSFKPRTPLHKFCSPKCNPKNRPHFCLNCGKLLPKDGNRFCSSDCTVFFRIKMYEKERRELMQNARPKEVSNDLVGVNDYY